MNVLPLTPISLFLAQAVAHIATIYWLIRGPTLQEAGLVFAIYFVTGCLGMSVCYHRLLTHRSFECPQWIEKLFTLFATVGLTGSSISWTAAHRLHHSRTDKPGDPHSPKILGYVRAQWGSMFSPFSVARSPVFYSRFHRLIHRYYFLINGLYAITLFLAGGLEAVLVGWLVPACLLWNSGSLINTVCHTNWLGYKDKNPASALDASVNVPILGVLMWGEGYHSSHHVAQRNPRIGRRWWELDIGYLVICLIRKARTNG
jgi:fatty-acid desaturase